MSVVGRAYVNVRAVTREVEGDIGRGVDDAMAKTTAKMRESGGQKLGDSIGEGVKESSLSTKIEESVRSTNSDRAGHDLGQSIGDSLFREGSISRNIKRAVSSVLPDVNETGKKIEDTLDARISKGIAKGFGKVAFNPISWIAVAVPPAITQGFTLLSAAMAGAVQLASSMGPVFALAGATGLSALTTVGTAAGALVLAFKAQTGEVENLKEGLVPLQTEFRKTAQTIQEQLFPVLSQTATRVDAALGPEVRTGLILTSDVVGHLAERFGTLSEQKFFQADVASIMESNAFALRDFGSAGIFAVQILADIGGAAGPAVEQVAKSIRSVAGGLADSVRAGAESGKLTDFFNRAVDTTFQWSRIIADISSGLGTIFDLGSDGKILNRLEDVTQGFRDWADSATGRGSISEWFDNAQPVLHATGGLLKSFGGVVGDLSGDTGSLVKTLDAVTDAMPGLGHIVGETAGHFADLLGIILPVIGSLAERLAPAVGDTSAAITDSLGPALDRVVGPIGDAAEAALSLSDNLAPLVDVAGRVLAPALDLVATGLEGVNAALDLMPGPVATTILSLVALKIGFSQLATSTKFGPAIAGFKTNLAAARVAAAATETSFVGLRAAATTTMATLGGPLGIALAVASVAFGIFAGKSDGANASVTELTDALVESTGAINDNIRAMQIKKLEDEGALRIAEGLGINYGLVQDAALGSADAQAELARQLDAIAQAGIDAGEPIDDTTDKLVSNGLAAEDLRDIMSSLAGDFDEAAAASKRITDASEWPDRVNRAAEQASRQVSHYDGIVDRLAKTTRGAADDTRTLARTIISVRDASIKGIDAQIGFRAAMSEARKQFADSKDTLDLYTGAGRDNVGALLDIAKAAEKVTGSAKDQQKAMKEARDKVLELARSKTDDEGAAKKLTDQIFKMTTQYDKVPKKVKTNVESPTLADRIEDVKTLRRQLEDLNGDTFSFNVVQGGSALPEGGGSGGGGAGLPGRPRTTTTTPDDKTPESLQRAGAGGVNFNGPISIQSSDYRDVLKKLHGKTRATQLAGYGGTEGNDL